MKKAAAAVCLLGLVVLMLSGCGAAGKTYCTDEAILSKLKNDDSPECVLDGEYYSLPMSAGELIGNGWSMTIDGYEGQQVILQPGERTDVTFAKNGSKVSAVLVNDSLLPLEAGENCSVIRVGIFVSQDEMSENYFVTKYGITNRTSAKDVRAILKDKDGFKETSDMYYLTSKGDLGARDILYFSSKNGYTSIKIASAEDWAYKSYKPLEQKAQEQADNIAAYKAEAEKNCPEDYAQIVQGIEATETLYTVPFCSIAGTVVYKGTGNYEGMENNLLYGQDLSLYAVQDKSGQIYCIFEGFAGSDVLKLPELAEGDVISVWGFASKVTTFGDGYKAPTIITKIVEKDGELIYLSDSLQVN